jgi:hypothetical protein
MGGAGRGRVARPGEGGSAGDGQSWLGWRRVGKEDGRRKKRERNLFRIF